jgi:glycosyltransferase involved in cell wall biosynthesis
MPKISVIIPVYNVRQYLDQCLNSLAEQTYKNLEIILVDDGSTDGSSEICDSYSEKDERFKVIHQNNAGVSSARNAGLNAVSGEWIMFMDADDWIENDTCEAALNCAVRNDADTVLFNMIYEYVGQSEVCCAYNEEFRMEK